MHASQLVELAAVLVALPEGQAGTVSESGARRAMTRYWVASRVRVERWGGLLSRLERRGQRADGQSAEAIWCVQKFEGLARELFLADVLARTWTAWLGSHLAPRTWNPWQAVADGVWRSHLDVRAGLLQRLAAAPGWLAEDRQRDLNRQRLRAERWSDLLIGLLGGPMGDLAFDVRRAERSGEPVGWMQRQATADALIELVAKSFPWERQQPALNPDLNREIGLAVVGGWGGMTADGSSWPAGVSWPLRITAMLEMTQGAIDQLDSEAAEAEAGVGSPGT